MTWQTVNFYKLVELLLPSFLRREKSIAYLSSNTKALEIIADRVLYSMQHDGRTIYLEKVLNEHFNVPGYDTDDHEGTKTVYIEEADSEEDFYVHLDQEEQVEFLNDADDDQEDIFIETETETPFAYAFIVWVPEAYEFQEVKLRAFIDIYRYIGKKYIIQTY